MALFQLVLARQSDLLKTRGRFTRFCMPGIFGMLCLIWSLLIPPAFADDSAITCDAHKGVCSQTLGATTVSLEISPRPVKAMQDLVFKVVLSGSPQPESPYIDLGMPGMKMGPNRVELKENGAGTYEGRGVIVRCKSGRRTWFANVTIPGTGELKFIFDVIY
jgi:hypothetical protein